MQNDIQNELSTNFIEYAYAVNSDRSIPDSKSGLKPVAKRILYDMYLNKNTSNKPHVKCARIYGDVMGRFHPHGDSSIYGALVRLAQDWVLRYPLIDFHGNKGNFIGDGPAAGRYTEARLSKISEVGLLDGLKKHCVDYIPNYDETEEEPVTLPAVFPNLLCNPNSGIGVAIACNWAPHNLGEVAQAIHDYVDGKEPMLPGPDFPMGGIVINKNDIPQIMKTGHGSVKIRGKYEYNEKKNEIVFTEIPYGTTVEGIIDQIAAVTDTKEIEGIADVRDASTKKGAKIVISLKKGVDGGSAVRKLFTKTDLQTSFSYNQVALVNKTPTELNLEDCIKIYLEHNEDCICKESEFDLQKAKERLEIVDGLIKALEDIDNIITLIKSSESSGAAKDALMNKYQFTENQAKAILAMRLSSLAKLEKVQLNEEKESLTSKMNNLRDILEHSDRRVSIILERLDALVKKFGDARRTALTQQEVAKEDKEIEQVIPEDVVVITTQTGYIKRVPTKSFKVQRRGGKGVKTKDEAILSMIKTNTIDALMVFTSKGKMYRLIVDNIPQGTNATKGVLLQTLVKMDADEKIMAVTSLHRDSQPEFVIFFTKNGLIKKSKLEEYTGVKKSTGIQAIKLKDGDSIANISFQDSEDLVLITKNGMGIKMKSESINPIGRVTSGVKGINLKDGDSLLIGLPIHKSTDNLAIFGANGYATKIKLDDLTLQNRGGRGVIIYNSAVAGAAMVDNTDTILLVGDSSICISTTDIPLQGRAAQGNKMIKEGEVRSIVKF